MRTKLLFTLILLCAVVSIQAQSKKSTSKGNIAVKGTSSMHDWEIKSSSISGYILATLDGNKLSSISEINFSLPVETLKSGKSGMDKNTFKALKSEENKNITFISKNVSINGNEVTADGTLSIAGTSNNDSLTATCTAIDGKVVCKGGTKFKMTTYNIDPPTAMFGSIKTGDDVEIIFDVTYK